MKLVILRSLLWVGIFGIVVILSATTLRAQSTLDGFDPNANASILVTVVQPDGKILIGGDFTFVSPSGGPAVARNRIARFNPSGTLDTSFNPDANQLVTTIAVQADGQILVGGIFTSIGGQTRNNIARLDAVTGAADLSFNPNANLDVYSIVVESDNKILVGGAFNGANSIGGQTRNFIARLETTGAVDTFDPNANGSIFSIAVQANGKILAGGAFTSFSPNGGAAVTRNRIARLETNGTVDATFNPNANNSIFSIVLQWDGKIFAGGAFNGANSIGGAARNYIARLNIDGTADSFNPSADSDVFSIAVQRDGRILAGGLFNTIGGQARSFIARLDAVFGSAESFNPNPNGAVNWIAVQQDDKILIAGDFTVIGPTPRNSIARFGTGTTAASVSIVGRVFAPNGGGLKNANVYLADNYGTSHSARTSSFGYFRFDEIEAGQSVVITVVSKRYRFRSQVMSVGSDLSGVDFYPEP